MPKPTVFIPGKLNPLVATMFLNAGWSGTKDFDKADLIVFCGGADISPRLYGEQQIKEVRHTDPERDSIEVQAFENARTLGIPMVGICRGAQLLNVLNGGKLFQHADNHLKDHKVVDLRTNEVWTTTSTHHQMMRPNEKTALLVAAASDDLGNLSSLCSIKKASGLEIRPDKQNFKVDAEVVWYEKTMSLCFQGHPEFSTTSNTTAERFWLYLDEFIMEDSKVA